MPDTPPAERLLQAAATLFPKHGIRAVGVDLLLREAGVARASLYQHFGSKDGLVAAYLRRIDGSDRDNLESARASVPDPRERALLAFDGAAKNSVERDYPGCVYLNAAGEYSGPDADENVCIDVVRDHRRWLAALWHDDVTELGLSDSDAVVRELVLLYDGALAGSRLQRSTEPITLARELAARRLGA